MWLPQSRGFSEVVLAICIEPARAQPCIMLARTQPQSSRLHMADYPGVGSRTGRTQTFARSNPIFPSPVRAAGLSRLTGPPKAGRKVCWTPKISLQSNQLPSRTGFVIGRSGPIFRAPTQARGGSMVEHDVSAGVSTQELNVHWRGHTPSSSKRSARRRTVRLADFAAACRWSESGVGFSLAAI